MLWVRKGITGLLTLILTIALVGLAMSASLSSAFSSPKHVTHWVESSDFYPGILSKASSDTAGSLDYLSLDSQLSTVIQQSLSSVFTKADFNQDVSKIINSNYAWLKGQTSTPGFNVNLSSQKNAFASDLGNYAATRYQALPECSASAIANLGGINPVTSTCKVPNVTADVIKSQIISDIDKSNIVVKNTDITPSTITKVNGAPYYTKFNGQSLYKHIIKYGPIGAALLSIICIVGIFFLSARKSRAIRKIGLSFIASGLILVILVAGTSKVESAITKHLDKHPGLSSFDSSISSLVHKIVSYVNGINLWFGVAYLVIGLCLLGFIFWKKHQVKPKKSASQTEQPNESEQPELSKVQRPHPPSRRSSMDVMPPTTNLRPNIQPSAPPLRTARPAHKPANKRRLIQ